jgi:hypothetical protein
MAHGRKFSASLAFAFRCILLPLTGWWDAAGGDMETATTLFFSMQDAGAGALPEPGAADAIGFEPPPWYR